MCLGETCSCFEGLLVAEGSPAQPPALRLEAVLDNIRSAWNVGAIFRSADGLGVSKIHLCGITPSPENAAVRKTALGAENFIPWQASRNALKSAQMLQAQGLRLVALEQSPRAVALTAFTLRPAGGIALIVGNEVTGVDPALLEMCDDVVEIPMRGQKRSLNVEVAFAIAAHWLANS
ncbi:MAG: hypothetical protein AUK01_01380 [Anaerolineae bacterium CG2_30_57_67]|nr:MAG: hypothetical protein AUK01_01380 [Anaerolineae bacterium CG2_30_57_67]